MMKKTWGEHLFDIGNTGFMIMLSILTLYPFLFVLFNSLSDPAHVIQNRGFILYPHDVTFTAYRLVFLNPNISTAYLNTLLYVVVGTGINLLLTSLGAYSLSRKHVMWRDVIMFMIVFTMFFDGGLIPLYILVGNLGMLDTRWALLVPSAISAFNLIIMRTAFQAVPDSLEESARMDGAGDWTILFRVVLPLSLPVVAVMTLFYGVHHWNSWFPAMIYIQDRSLLPLQMILREILILNDSDSMLTSVSGGEKQQVGETIKYATIIVATVPILLLYPFLQKYFVKGVMIGAIKG